MFQLFPVINFMFCFLIELVFSKTETLRRPFMPDGKLSHVFKENAGHLSLTNHGIVKHIRANQDNLHDIIFFVKLKNLDELDRILWDVSNPESKNYGNYLTRDEVAELTSNIQAKEGILKYLQQIDAELVEISPYQEFITARAKISVWEKEFDTEFYHFHYKSGFDDLFKIDTLSKESVIRAEKYSVRKELEEHVEYVFNTIQMPFSFHQNPGPHINFMEPIDAQTLTGQENTVNSKEENNLKEDVKLSAIPVVAGVTTPAKLNSAYNVDSNTAIKAATQAIYATINQKYSPADLRAFQINFGLPIQAVDKFTKNSASDAECLKPNPDNCTESNLDIQYIMASAQGANNTHW